MVLKAYTPLKSYINNYSSVIYRGNKNISESEKRDEYIQTKQSENGYLNYTRDTVKNVWKEEEGIYIDNWMSELNYVYMTNYYQQTDTKEKTISLIEETCKEVLEFFADKEGIKVETMNVEDKKNILSLYYFEAKRENIIAAANVCVDQKSIYASQYGNPNDWRCIYYDSSYYYECQEMEQEIQKTILNIAQENGIEEMDFEQIAKSYSKHHYAGINFNYEWNVHAQATCTISMIAEDMVPPKDFSFFYQNCKTKKWDLDNVEESQKGILVVNYKNSKWVMDIPFNRYVENEEEMIEFFHVKDFFEKYSISKNEVDITLLKILSNFDIFSVQWYKQHESRYEYRH